MTRWCSVWMALVSAAGPQAAGAAPQGGAGDAREGRSGSAVLGVVRGLAHEPLSGARLWLNTDGAQPTSVATSDEQGRYALSGIAPGLYRLVCHRSDRVPVMVEGLVLESTAPVRVDVVLDPGTRIVGRLVGPGGRPLAGQVALVARDGRPVPPPLAPLLRAPAEPDGRFQLPAAPAGELLLAVAAPGHGVRRLAVTLAARQPEVDLGDVRLELEMTVSGRVRDDLGHPIPRSVVRAFASGAAPPAAQVAADAGGSFVLAGLGAGRHRVTASAPGHATASREVDAGARGLELVLARAGTIVGTVTDETGRPLTAFRVEAQPQRPGLLRVSGPARVDGDAHGRFSVEGLGGGAYVVEIAAPDRVPRTLSDVAVRPGLVTDLGRVRVEAGGAVRGTVLDASGGPVAGARVTAFAAGGDALALRRPPSVSDETGSFELRGVPAGSVDVVARHSDFAEGRVSGVDVDPSQGPVEVQVVLRGGGRIEGRALQRDGGGRSGLRVVVAPLATENGQPAGALWTTVAPDGSFVFPRVLPGRHRLTLIRGTPETPRHATQSQELTVSEGLTTVVELTSQEIVVAGRVTRRGSPAPGLRVTLTAPGSTHGLSAVAAPAVAGDAPGPMAAVTGEDGSFELTVEQPGRLLAHLESADGRLRYPARVVDVPDTVRYSLDLRVPGLVVTGIVLDQETEGPLPSASVMAMARTPGGTGVSASVEQDGRFRLELDPGVYRLTASAMGYVSQELDLTLEESATSELRLLLRPGRSIEGRVVDSLGRAVGGAMVVATSGDPGRDEARDAAITRPDGSFRLERLAARRHSLLVEDVHGEFGFLPQVAPGAAGTVLALRPGGRAQFQVRDLGGAPVAGAFVTPLSLGGVRLPPLRQLAATDGEGRAQMLLPSGSLVVEVRKGSLGTRLALEIPEGGDVSIEAQLGTSGTTRTTR